jgi:hypothetical protein
MHSRLAPSLSGRAERESFVPRQSSEFPTAYAVSVLHDSTPSTVTAHNFAWLAIVALASVGCSLGVSGWF